jgi:hypothetical protein
VSTPRTRKTAFLGAFLGELEFRQIVATRGRAEPADLELQISAWRRGAELLKAAESWPDASPRIAPLDHDTSLQVGAIVETPAFRETTSGLQWEFVDVELQNLRAFQFTVDKGYACSFASLAGEPSSVVAGVTLPSGPRQLPVVVTGDNSGVTLTSPGPNLRVSGMAVAQGMNGAPQVIVDLTFGSPFFQVAEFGGRFFLKNGYHRAYGLLSAGITSVPAVLVHCRNYADTGATGPGFFAEHLMVGAKPPLMSHYFSPFAVEFDQLEFSKTVRLRPDEFQVLSGA